MSNQPDDTTDDVSARVMDDMLWVYSHFDDEKPSFPRPGARHLWDWATGNPDEWYKAYVPKILVALEKRRAAGESGDEANVAERKAVAEMRTMLKDAVEASQEECSVAAN